MYVQALAAAMNSKDIGLLKEINIQFNFIIGNQYDKNEIKKLERIESCKNHQ